MAEDILQIYKVQMVLMFEWAERLDEFRLLSSVDKVAILCSMMISIGVLFVDVSIAFVCLEICPTRQHIQYGESVRPTLDYGFI
jgi:hypothetical protein